MESILTSRVRVNLTAYSKGKRYQAPVIQFVFLPEALMASATPVVRPSNLVSETRDYGLRGQIEE